MDARPTKKRRSALVVEVNGFRRYRPGSGPPLRPITLVPPRDSTAYIVTKLVMPIGVESSSDVQRRMHYLIGWRDLPAASATIPATQILEYVSRAELEAWEYNELLRREAEELRLAEEASKGNKMHKKTKRPRGRPPKAQLADQLIETPELSSSEEALVAHKKASGPSLSTPQKSLQLLLRDDLPQVETGDEDNSDEAAILRQLESDLGGTDGLTQDEEYEGDTGMVDATDVPVPERSRRKVFLASRQDSSRSSSLVPGPPPDLHIGPVLSNLPRKVEKKVAVGKRKGNIKASVNSLRESAFNLPASSNSLPSVAEKTPAKKHIIKETYIPPPKIPPPKIPSSSRQVSSPPRLSKNTVHPMFSKPIQGNQTSPNARLASDSVHKEPNTTPNPSQASSQEVKVHPALLRQQKLQRSAGSSRTGSPPQSESLHHTGVPLPAPASSSGFTPAGSSRRTHKPRPRAAPSPPVPVRSAASVPVAKDSTTKEKRNGKTKPALEEQQDWEVKALLDDRRRYDTKNKLVHEYKVLWAGNWPPDQNPTWEPERNIPKSVIQEYLKKRVASGKKQRTLLTYMPKRRFSNVAEAFAGELGEEVDGSNTNGVYDDDDGSDGDDEETGEEQLVVADHEELMSSAKRRKPSTPAFKKFDRSLAIYNDEFGRTV